MDNVAYAGYTDEQKAHLTKVFEDETNDGVAWYNRGENANNANNFDKDEEGHLTYKWGCGLKPQLIGLQYESALGYIDNGDGTKTNFYRGVFTNSANPTIEFQAAGTYYVNQINLYILYNGELVMRPKTDFVWSNSGTQSSTSYGDVKATILPAELDIYALYSRKTFGNRNNPIVNVLKDSYESLLDQPMNGNPSLQSDPASYLFVAGLLGDDYNEYASVLASCWRRTTGESADLYAVYVDLFNESGVVSGLEGLLNNYGIHVSALTDTFGEAYQYDGVTYGGINLHRVNGLNDRGTPNDYTDDTFGNFDVCENTFDYLSATDTIGETFKIFEIIPFVLEAPTLTDSAYHTYDGNAWGVTVSFGTINNSSIEGIATKFKGIPVPDEWDEWDEARKLKYVDDNKNTALAQEVGTNGNGGIVDASKPVEGTDDFYDFLYFTQINAGEYSLLIVDVTNSNYKFEGYFLVEWTIHKATIDPNPTLVGSDLFGTTNYGGYSFSFSNIASGDEVGFTVTETSPSNLGFRYKDLENNLDPALGYNAIVDGETTYYYYGKYAGNYQVNFSNPQTITFREHNDFYGEHYDNNYTMSGEVYRGWEIKARPLVLSETATLTHDDMVYNYNVAKGITITISNFFDADFATNDVAPDFLNDIGEYITFGSEVSSGSNTATYGELSLDGTGALNYTFTAYNKGSYYASITQTMFTYQNGDQSIVFENYTLTQKTYNYDIASKVIRLEWILVDGSGNPVLDGMGNKVYSVEYDKVTTYTLTAGFIVGGASEYSTTDYMVYAEDFDSISGKITTTRGGDKNVGITLVGTVSANQVSNENDDEVYVVTANQISGNYYIEDSQTEEEGQQSQTWEIRRKVLSGVDFGPELGTTHNYDGQPYGVTISLALVPGDTLINGFAGNNIVLNTNADFSSSDTGIKFVATNAGVYTLVAEATDQKIDRNYILTFTANYDENNPLFTITPRVLEFTFNSSSADYTASQIDTFVATANLVTGDSLSWGYIYTIKEVYGTWANVGNTVSRIVNAGVYTIAVDANSLQGDTVTLNNYTFEGATKTSADCTVNRYSVAITSDVILPPVAPDNSYNGSYLSVQFASISAYLLDGDINKDKTDAVSVPGQAYNWLTSGSTSEKYAGSYTVTINGISNNFRGENNYELAQSVSKEWEIVKRELTIEWVPFNTYYYNSSNLANIGGNPESGNGTLASPFLYYYNGNGALGSANAREVGVYVIVKEGLIAGDVVQLAIESIGEGANSFYTSIYLQQRHARKLFRRMAGDVSLQLR